MKHLHDVSVSLRVKSQKLERLHGGIILILERSRPSYSLNFKSIMLMGFSLLRYIGPLVHHTIEAMRNKAIHDIDPKKVIVYSTVSEYSQRELEGGFRCFSFHFISTKAIFANENSFGVFVSDLRLYLLQSKHAILAI